MLEDALEEPQKTGEAEEGAKPAKKKNIFSKSLYQLAAEK